MGAFGGGVGAFLGVASPNFVDDVCPSSDTNGEHWHLWGVSSFTEESCDEHDQRSAKEAPEQHSGGGTDSSEDEVELSNLQWDGDQPVDVSEDERRRSFADPVVSHVGVVVPCNTRDECGNGHGGLPLGCNVVSLHNEENSRCKHHCSCKPERDGHHVGGVKDGSFCRDCSKGDEEQQSGQKQASWF